MFIVRPTQRQPKEADATGSGSHLSGRSFCWALAGILLVRADEIQWTDVGSVEVVGRQGVFMRLVRTVAMTLICAFSSSLTASGSFSTDQSDLWWGDPPGSENGWGLQLIQRSSTIFATMFVYAPSGDPTWYVSTMMPTGAPLQWSGDLYATTGPWFGTVPYNPASVTVRKVGTMRWTASSGVTGILSYTIDGVAVSKNLIRQTLVSENYGGHFAGGIHQTNAGCANPDFNGTFEQIGVLNVVQNGSALTMTFFQPE